MEEGGNKKDLEDDWPHFKNIQLEDKPSAVSSQLIRDMDHQRDLITYQLNATQWLASSYIVTFGSMHSAYLPQLFQTYIQNKISNQGCVPGYML